MSSQKCAQLFAASSLQHLHEEYIPRIERALEVLPEEDLWWRPHDGANSVGNLLLHLAGNVRQWILSGLAHEPDHRVRDSEFQVDGGSSAEDLLAQLRATVREAAAVIETMTAEDLERDVVIQGFEITGLGAVYHVVEHFSWHTGQIAFVAKMRSGPHHGLAFYDDSQLRERNENAG